MQNRVQFSPVSVMAVAVALFGAVSLSTPAQALTLEDALAAAYLSNPTLEAERARVRAVDEQVPQALSNWRPRVDVTGDYGRRRTETGGVTPRYTTTTPHNLGIRVQQNLFRGFRTQNQTSAAEHSVLAARSGLNSVEQQILLSAVESYVDVLRDQAVLDLNRNNEEVLQRQLEATQDRFEVGEITRTSVSQAESRLAGAVAARVAAEGTLRSSMAVFERIIGLPAEDLSQPGALPPLPETLEEALRMAEQNQPQVLAADYNALAAQDAIRVVGGELLPTVALEASYGRRWDATTRDSYSGVAEIKATLVAPLYEGGFVYSRLREAKHQAGQRRIEVDVARQSARAQGVIAWESLNSAAAQISAISAQVEAASIALEGVQREAQVGARTILDVLDAEQELLDARVNLVRAQRNHRVAAYQMLSATGLLNAQTLGLEVDLYDPIVHYGQVRDQWIGGNDMATEDAQR